jgi:hypothetical protein
LAGSNSPADVKAQPCHGGGIDFFAGNEGQLVSDAVQTIYFDHAFEGMDDPVFGYTRTGVVFHFLGPFHVSAAGGEDLNSDFGRFADSEMLCDRLVPINYQIRHAGPKPLETLSGDIHIDSCHEFTVAHCF